MHAGIFEVVGELLEEQANPDELSPGVIICPSTLTGKGRNSG
jgi:hypothetical protein